MLTFRARYFIVTLILFVTEVFIALYLHDSFIRPYFGDFLVVILMYCFVRSFCNIAVLPVAIGVLLFSFVIETLQYFNFLSILHLQHSQLAKLILGSSFAWSDLLAYTLGILLVVFIEKRFRLS